MMNDNEMNAAEQAQVFIPLPTEADVQIKSDAPVDIDFNYRGLCDEERIRRAVKDMEILYASDESPKMPQQKPRFVKAYLWNTPDFYKPAYSQAGFPAAAVQMDNVSFRHPNNLFVPA